MSHTFSAAYDRVLKATGCAGQEELAKKLGLRQSFITDCRRRGEFTPEVLLALVERCNLNPHWVRTGEGEKCFPRSEAEAAHKLAGVKLLCIGFDRGRGIWKQVDENRELLQFLFSEFPEIKERAFFIESWIEDTDIFLNCLIELLELKQSHPSPFFPRHWPGLLPADVIADSKRYAQLIMSQIKGRP